jgi:hypothetical protein
MFVLLKALPSGEDITNSSLIVPTTRSLAAAIQSFSAKDLSILSPLDNEYIKDMVFQQDPDRIIWVLTELGRLFGLTFEGYYKFLFNCTNH